MKAELQGEEIYNQTGNGSMVCGGDWISKKTLEKHEALQNVNKGKINWYQTITSNTSLCVWWYLKFINKEQWKTKTDKSGNTLRK